MGRRRGGLAVWMALVPVAAGAQGYDERRLVGIAREAVVAAVRGAKAARPPGSTMARPVFVTIEIDGRVCGCRGDLTPRARSLEEEVALAARSAAAHDPRYRPLDPSDLERFRVTVTVVERTEPIANVGGLTPEDGLVLRAGGRTGIVLPWEGKDPQTRLDWAYRKAGVGKGTAASFERLVAQRFRG